MTPELKYDTLSNCFKSLIIILIIKKSQYGFIFLNNRFKDSILSKYFFKFEKMAFGYSWALGSLWRLISDIAEIRHKIRQNEARGHSR